MSIELDEGVISRGGRPALYFASATPRDPKAMLAVIHGYADHGARYRHVMGALAEHGIAAVAIDLRGHGRAEGTRGYCARFGEFLDDVNELKTLALARAKGVPLFLFGHSFGGLVASTAVLAKPTPWKGLLLSAPFFGLALDVPALKVAAGRLASRIVPKLGLPSGLFGKDMTHDAEKASAYDADPLVFKNATARWFTETTTAQTAAIAGARRLELPLYEAFGTSDHVSSISAAKRFFDAAGSSDKTWDAREGLFHEILNEPSWKDIVETMSKWILARA